MGNQVKDVRKVVGYNIRVQHRQRLHEQVGDEVVHLVFNKVRRPVDRQIWNRIGFDIYAELWHKAIQPKKKVEPV
jgi:hypothetical protein